MKAQFKFAVMISCVVILGGCGGGNEQKSATGTTTSTPITNTSDPMANKGIGPVKQVTLGELNPAMASEGEEIYKKMCTACHKPTEKFIGPAPKGVLERRSPEWIMNMILNPEEMIKSDPIAKQLLIQSNMAPMANQHLTEEQARKVLEYFRTIK